jgi:hypothetical protein
VGQVLQLPSSRSRLSTRATSDPFRVIHPATDQRRFLTLRYFLPGQVFLLSYLLPAGQVFLLSYLLPGGSGISTFFPNMSVPVVLSSPGARWSGHSLTTIRPAGTPEQHSRRLHWGQAEPPVAECCNASQPPTWQTDDQK